jgi:hypothetical protein
MSGEFQDAQNDVLMSLSAKSLELVQGTLERVGAATDAEWLTVTEAAFRSGKSERTVQRWCQRGVIGAQLVTTPEGEAWKIDPATLPQTSDGVLRVTPEVTPLSDTVTPYGAPVTPYGAPVTPPKQGGDAIPFEGDAIRCVDSERVTPTGDATVTPFSEGDANGDAILKQGDATPKTSDGVPFSPELSPLAARYMAQLETENAFLRATVEEANRNAAELRAALREALKLQSRALPSPREDSTTTAPSAQEVCSVSASTSPESASSGARISQPEAQEQPESSEPALMLSGALIEAQRPVEVRRRGSWWKWLIGG